MAFDFIDMLVDTKDEYLTGHFYKRRPRTPEDGKIVFKYKQLDPNSKIFDTVLGNVRADSARYAIETNDHCGFNIGGYIVTQNGLIWEITEVITNEQANGSNNTLRWFTTAKNAKCSVRMIQVTDLFDKEESYIDECKINVNLVGELPEGKVLSGKVSYSTNGEPVENGTVNINDINTFDITVSKGKTVKFVATLSAFSSSGLIAYPVVTTYIKEYQTLKNTAEINIEFGN